MLDHGRLPSLTFRLAALDTEDVAPTIKLRRARAFLEGAIAAVELLDPTRTDEVVNELLRRAKLSPAENSLG